MLSRRTRPGVGGRLGGWLTGLGAWMSEVTLREPLTNVVGTARSLLALSTLLTLGFNDSSVLFRPAYGVPPAPYCMDVAGAGLFCQAPTLEAGRWIGVAILVVTLTGWRPRVTAIPHWWVAFSLQTSATVVDGGDQAVSVLTALLVPLCLLDGRRNHWQAHRSEAAGSALGEVARTRRLLCLGILTMIRIQVAVIYFHAGVAKLNVTEWMDGTAMYYWLSDPMFGSPTWLGWLLDPVLRSGPALTLFTWSVVVGEIVLSAALFMPRRYRRFLLPAAVAFHAGIALCMGLVSFALAMIAADILFLRPTDEPFRLRRRSRPTADVPRDLPTPADAPASMA